MNPSIRCVGARVCTIRPYGSGAFIRYLFEGWKGEAVVLATTGEIVLFDWPWKQQYLLNTGERRGEVRRIIGCAFRRHHLLVMDIVLKKSRLLERQEAVEDIWLHLLTLCESDKEIVQRLSLFAAFLRTPYWFEKET